MDELLRKSSMALIFAYADRDKTNALPSGSVDLNKHCLNCVPTPEYSVQSGVV